MDRTPPQQPAFGGYPQPLPDAHNYRFAEPAKFLPVAFLATTIFGLYLIYVLSHCLALLQLDVPFEHQDDSMKRRGIIQLAAFHYITFMLVFCYVRAILVSPGDIPDNDVRWAFVPQETPGGTLVNVNLQEMKRSGERRHCKWCSKYKPDRCHHCRVYRTCILKMDHHCPWIYNCVGFKNYKYFFLLLLYAVLDTHCIVWTMSESVQRSLDSQAPFFTMFLHVFGVTLAFWMSMILTTFFGFHVWLMFQAMTIIEFCEKSSQPRKDQQGGERRSFYSSVYDQGCFGNIKAVLGPNPLLWFIPISPPIGDGLTFVTDETRLMQERAEKKANKQKARSDPYAGEPQQQQQYNADPRYGDPRYGGPPQYGGPPPPDQYAADPRAQYERDPPGPQNPSRY